MAERLWRIAAAGNPAVLVLVVMLLAPGELYQGVSGAGQTAAGELYGEPAPPPAADRALLVVIDALRLDAAADPALMPHLAALGDAARGGGRGEARVGSPIPSTVAGIRALAEGLDAPAASFLEDFRARPATDGGLLAALAGAGGSVYVAGPRLWWDLYGRSIAAGEPVTSVGEDDERLLAAAEARLRRPPAGRAAGGGPELVVVHLGRPDDAAHLHGGDSAAYRRAVAWCDRALGRLLAAAGQSGAATAVLVTSDHGVTAAGGHAGPEPSVLRVPLVVAGPGMPVGDLGSRPQRQVHRLLLTALGLPAAGPAAGASPVPWPDRARPLLAVLAALLAAGRLWAALAAGLRGRGRSILHDATVWTTLLAATLWGRIVALLVALAGLAAGTLRLERLRAAGVLAGLGLGLGLGAVRLADGYLGLGREGLALAGAGHPAAGSAAAGPPAVWLAAAGVALVGLTLAAPAAARPPRWRWQPRPRLLAAGVALVLLALALGGPALAAAALAAAGLGWALGRVAMPRRRRARAAPARLAAVAAGVALAPPLLARLLGETVSLSGLDVRAAFALVDGPLGLAGAVTAASLRQAVVPWALALALAPALAASSPRRAGALAAVLGAVAAGQGGAALALLLDAGGATTATSLAVGLAIRTLTDACFLFLGLALGVWLAGARRRILSLPDP